MRPASPDAAGCLTTASRAQHNMWKISYVEMLPWASSAHSYALVRHGRDDGSDVHSVCRHAAPPDLSSIIYGRYLRTVAAGHGLSSRSRFALSLVCQDVKER